jgi:hypothetical protein
MHLYNQFSISKIYYCLCLNLQICKYHVQWIINNTIQQPKASHKVSTTKATNKTNTYTQKKAKQDDVLFRQ